MGTDIQQQAGIVKPAKRQRWDIENDRPKVGPVPLVEEHAAWRRAVSQAIPEYRAKLVRLPYGQTEISVTPANRKHIIDLRMGFNPLLDLPTRRRTDEEQAERDEENRKRSTKRARQSVRHLVKCLFADHMLTFTYRENVEDRDRVARDWKEFVRLFRLRYPEWHYLAVLEKQERGAYHIHVAVKGRQDIKWLLRCWLLSIGQPVEEVNDWYIRGVKLADKSFGSVNVEPPRKRWGGVSKQWQRNKLAGYLTKYIGKEFEESDKGSKKYWHSRLEQRPQVERFWLKALTYEQAIIEAHDLVYFSGATSISMWNDHKAGVVWITGETDRERLGQFTQCQPGWDLIED